MPTPRIETEDVQGVILRGYQNLKGARFALLAIDDVAGARRWLAELAGEIRTAAGPIGGAAINVAFTHGALARLGLGPEPLSLFSRELHEGVAGDEHRTRILGDHGESDPQKWAWGGPLNPPLDVLLLLYATDEPAVAQLYAAHRARFTAAGLREIGALDTVALPDRKEHFGFRDGIGQPGIGNGNSDAERIGLLKPVRASNTIAPGEFLLGYPNEYGQYPLSPIVPPAEDPRGALPPDASGSSWRDFGRNGSYLVVRQLSQDVLGFWRYVAGSSRRGEDFVRLAAQMVGRWPNGAPLVKAPDHPVDGLENDDDFTYGEHGDEEGYKCPLGAHARRANPRDVLVGGEKEPLAITKRHRIIRRGRPYGAPVDPSMDPRRILESADDGGARGLQFLGFNANLSRQFEFISQTWINDPKFAALYSDKDPLVGKQSTSGRSTFTVQALPVARRIHGLPRFVQVRGGAYFFMPGKAAIRYLASGAGGSPRPA